jgi:RNA polymerase sigma factor (TIGR02999 family)
MNDNNSLTEQLRRFSEGDREIAEEVLRAILPELQRIAARELRQERYVMPFETNELINEVWLRNLRNGGWKINDRRHFYAIAGLAMRRVLVDYARHRRAQRRGNGDTPISLDEAVSADHAGVRDTEKVIAIGMLMEELQKVHYEESVVVDLHYFAGYTFEEVADKTGWKLHQVRRSWGKGTDWLKDRL